MGYSHYWKIEEDMTVQEFKHLQGIAAKIAEASNAPVEFSTNTHPLHLCIVVEGINEGAHETFYLTPKAVEFGCCKTARKPYDEIVVGILDYANALGLLKFTSDGNPDDLAAGERLASVHYIAQDDEGCLTCDTEITNGGTWGYCAECWDEHGIKVGFGSDVEVEKPALDFSSLEEVLKVLEAQKVDGNESP